MDLAGKVEVVTSGRCGVVSVTLGKMKAEFVWEYGGGNCLVFVIVPSDDEWNSTYPLRKYKKYELLDALARELVRMECPGAPYEVSSDAITIYERPRSNHAVKVDAPDGPRPELKR